MTTGNTNGVRLTDADGTDIGPSDTADFVAGVDAPGCSVLVETVDPVTVGVEVWAHPMSPEGTYYPFDTSAIAMATGVIAAGDNAVMLHMENKPTNVFGITAKNNDLITHTLGVVVYGNGEA